MLPVFFYPEQQEFFWQLYLGAILAVTGFFCGWSIVSKFNEPPHALCLRKFPSTIDLRAVALSCLLLVGISLPILLFFQPTIFSDINTYEGRIAFQGESGPLAFLLNQAVVGSSIFIIYLFRKRKKFAALALTIFLIYFAFYANAKLSMLTAGAAWGAIWMLKIWKREVSRLPLFFTFAIFPLSLIIMAFYSTYRGLEGVNIAEVTKDFVYIVSELGEYGVNVGDYDGPFQVLTIHMKESAEPAWGKTYVNQWPVFLPRIWRGRFVDLTDEFASMELGDTYKVGQGFAFSPWAEGYYNFHEMGFLIEGFLFGLLSYAIWKFSVAVFGFNEIPVFFQIMLIVIFQRGYLIGQMKGTFVYMIGFVCMWFLARKLIIPIFFPVYSNRVALNYSNANTH